MCSEAFTNESLILFAGVLCPKTLAFRPFDCQPAVRDSWGDPMPNTARRWKRGEGSKESFMPHPAGGKTADRFRCLRLDPEGILFRRSRWGQREER